MSVQLFIQPISPIPAEKKGVPESVIPVLVQVCLSCGLPTCAGGRWDPRRFRVKASLFSLNGKVASADLFYNGNASEFSGSLKWNSPGTYTMVVEAQDPETGAAGRLSVEFQII